MRSIQRGIATSIILILFLVLGIAAVSGYFIFSQNQQKLAAINSFEDCAKAGFPVGESAPPQCWTPDGKHFWRELSEEEKEKLKPPAEVTSNIDEIINWKTYTHKELGVEFKYPQNYMILSEKDDAVQVALDKLGEGLVAVAKKPAREFLDYKSLLSCKDVTEPGNVCLDEGKKWGSDQDLVDIEINGREFKSYYLLQNGPGTTLRVFQSNGNPDLSVSYPLYAERYRLTQEKIVYTIKYLE